MKEITLDAVSDSIPKVTDWMETELQALACPQKSMMQIAVAIDELVTNIVSYAYPDQPGEFSVKLECDDGMATITFTDSGIPYDPLQKPDPDVTLPADQRKAGGLGIFLVKKLMDSMEYRREGERNIVTIRKRIIE